MMQCCSHAITVACEDRDDRIEDLLRVDASVHLQIVNLRNRSRAQGEQLDRAEIELARAEERDQAQTRKLAGIALALRKVLAILDRDGGFRTPRQMATMRGARVLIAELGQQQQGENNE